MRTRPFAGATGVGLSVGLAIEAGRSLIPFFEVNPVGSRIF
jgi:hypothetical protein